MHSHCEIIMPPTDDPKQPISEIMWHFSEHNEHATNPFHDWYQIGGRWSGDKLKASLDPEALEAFTDKLVAMKFTTSGVIAGKPRLMPESQQASVDAMWRAQFPDSPLVHCPFFDHCGSHNEGDIATLKDTPRTLTAHRFIFAGPTPLYVLTMLTRDVWNGVQYQDTTFDGTFGNALAIHTERTQRFERDMRRKYQPTDDWLVVTVDCHS